MKKIKFAFGALIFGFVAMFGAFAFSQIAPQPNFPHDRYKEFTPDKEVIYGQLPNGLRYGIKHWEFPKGQIAIRMSIAAGSLNENENQKGLMHFLEHMAFNGSKNVPEDEFDKILSREGLAFGADTNAGTSFDNVTYRLDMPKPEQLDLGLKMMRETAGNLTLAPKAIDRERGIIEAEERSRRGPALDEFIAFSNATFSGLRVNERLPIGDMKIVKTAKRPEFVKLYKSTYVPERIFIAIAGDIDPQKAEEIIKARFGDLEKSKNPIADPPLGKAIAIPYKIDILTKKELPAKITLTFTKPFINYDDTSEIRRKFLLRGIASSIINQRFAKIIASGNTNLLGVSLGESNFAQSVLLGTITAVPKDVTYYKEALEIADVELRRALEFGFTNEEFATALANLRNGYEQSVKVKNAVQSSAIAGQILGAFSSDSVLTTPEDELAWFEKNEKNLNKEDALKEFREQWADYKPQLFFTTPKEIEGGKAAVEKTWQEIRNIKPKPPEIIIAKSWNYTNFGTPSQIVEDNKIEDLNLNMIKYANGVHLVFKQTDFEKGVVRISVKFGNGFAGLKENSPILSNAIDAAFSAGGLGNFDITELQQVLAGHNVSLNFHVETKSFEMSAAVSQKDFALQTQLFTAMMTDSGWRDIGLKQFKAAKDNVYRQIDATPNAAMSKQIGQIIHNGETRFAFPTPEQWDAVSMEDIKSALMPALKNSAIEIIVIGDISKEDAIKQIGETFGALPKRDDLPNYETQNLKTSFPPKRSEFIITHKGAKDQGIFAIFWPIRDYGDGTEVRRIRILTEIFQIKLNEILREKYGSTYSPNVNWAPSQDYKDYGYIGAQVELKPDEMEKYGKAIEEIAKMLAKGEISQDLFNRARAPMLADFERTTHNNPWWAGALENSSFSDLNFKRIRGGKADYENATLEEVKALAKKYFDSSKAVIIKTIPETAPK